jgi:nucleoid DNA-binding protein
MNGGQWHFLEFALITCRFAFIKNTTVKIEQALVLYLLKHKQISLQGIGIFKIDAIIPESTDSDKPFMIPADAVSFTYDPKVREDNELIDFIVQNTKKIKPLASADLDSFLTLGRQFLNIGKPFTIQNLGTLEKLNNGDLEFKPGPLIQKVEVPKLKIEDEGAEQHEENLFNDYKRAPSNNNRALLVIFVIIILIAGAWAAWYFGFKKNDTEKVTTTDNIIPIADTMGISKKNDSLAATQKLTDSNNIQKNPADSFTFKVVVRETRDKEVAIARLAILKSFGREVIMYTTDSITYKVAEPFMLPLSDTTKILDSLNKKFYGGKAHIETR